MNTPLIRFCGDRNHPLMIALMDLPVEKRQGLFQVVCFDGYPINIVDIRKPQIPYMKALRDISQFLEEHGFEDAGDYLDKNYTEFHEKSCDL